tara:strand:- start:10584 stop:11534 length:951 start_codon:yes stop_codon:yes gene_type:complete
MMRFDPISSLSKQLKSRIILEPRLSDYSWWKIGGSARALVDIESIEDLMLTIKLLKKLDIRYCVIGEGTNLLFDDRGFDGFIIKIGRKFSKCTQRGCRLTVEAGHWIPSLIIKVAKLGYGGLEHAIGIPASLGGLVAMNGGSQRKNISEYIESVLVLDANGKLIEDKKPTCRFRYRASKYQESKEIILKVNFCFKAKKSYRQQRIEMLNILRERRLKFPRKEPSCGSVFKSSAGLFSTHGTPGHIIEKLGFKGSRKGNIQVSNLHANFIVNLGNGSSKDILSLIEEINDSAYEKIGVKMEPEFLYVHPQKGILKVV